VIAYRLFMESGSLQGMRSANQHYTNEPNTWEFDRNKNAGEFLHRSKGVVVPSDQRSPALFN
tara:strand:- start:152 stop:337 length:186 start_codon:yes stop_codon:yes gene_type:complete